MCGPWGGPGCRPNPLIVQTLKRRSDAPVDLAALEESGHRAAVGVLHGGTVARIRRGIPQAGDEVEKVGTLGQDSREVTSPVRA